MESVALTFLLTAAAAAAFLLLRGQRTRIRFPIATVVVAAITLVVSATAELVNALLELFSRDEGALLAGEWWRMLSPLLVQDGGWFGTISNTISLLIVGALTESLVPRWMWLLAYVGSGLVSEVAAYTVMPDQGFAGNSVAILGLAGLASVVVLVRSHGISRAPALIATVLGVGLLGVGNLHGVGFCAGALAGVVEATLNSHRTDSRRTGGG